MTFILTLVAKGLLQRPETQSHAGTVFYAVVAGILILDVLLGGSRLIREYRAPVSEAAPGAQEDGRLRPSRPTRSLIGEIRSR